MASKEPDRHPMPIPKRYLLGAVVLLLVSGVPAASAGGDHLPGDTEVVFGMSAPFSGTAKEYGRQVRLGYELAFSLANEAGGIAGRKVRLAAIDDNYEPARTVSAVRQLVEQKKVFGLVCVFGAASAAAVLPYVLENRILYYGGFTGAKLLRNDPPDRYVFNYRPSHAEETAAAVNYLLHVKRFKPSEIAVLHQDDSFGEAGWAGVAKIMRQVGHDPDRVVRVTYERNTADVAPAVEVIKRHARHLRAVVMVAVYKPAAKFIERLKTAGADLVFTNVGGVNATQLAEDLVSLGPSFSEGVIVTQYVPLPTSNSSAVLKYKEALRRLAPEEAPSFTSLETYVSGLILVEGLRRAGRNLTSESVVEALEGIRGLDLGFGMQLGFGPSEHQASHKVFGTILGRDGVYRSLELE